MGLQIINLQLKLCGRSPEIIALQAGYIFSLASRESGTNIGVHAHVSLMQQWPDDVRSRPGAILNNLPRFVRRAVFTNHQFNRKARFLHQYTVDRLTNKLFVVVCQHCHADLWDSFCRDCRHSSGFAAIKSFPGLNGWFGHDRFRVPGKNRLDCAGFPAKPRSVAFTQVRHGKGRERFV